MSDPKYRPVIFSGESVRAILDGRKTQWRFPVKPQPDEYQKTVQYPAIEVLSLDPLVRVKRHDCCRFWQYAGDATNRSEMAKFTYGLVGDRLYVKENWRTGSKLDDMTPSQIVNKCEEAGYGPPPNGEPWGRHKPCPIIYEADGLTLRWGVNDWNDFGNPGKLRPACTSPGWASRLTLEITGVRVERSQDITEADAKAEGVEMGYQPFSWTGPNTLTPVGYVPMYRRAWDKINGKKHPWASNPWCWVVEFKRVESNV